MPGGVVHQTSALTLDALARRAPGIPAQEFCRAVGIYSIERQHVAEPPRSVKDSLYRISESARALYDQLSTRSDELNDYLASECASFGRPFLPEELQPVLLRLAGLAANARNEVEVSRGRASSPRTRLIRSLASALERVGERVSPAPNGPLVQAFDLALKELGETIADSTGTVRSALEGYSGNNAASEG